MKWIWRLETGRERRAATVARRRQVEQRMKPLHTRSHKAARLVRERLLAARSRASWARHQRSVWREGDDGLRCFDCEHIPLHPWEPLLADQIAWHLE